MQYKEQNAFIKYKLELINKTMQDLADALDIHYQGLYRKLSGLINIREDEKVIINEFLELTELESSELWQK